MIFTYNYVKAEEMSLIARHFFPFFREINVLPPPPLSQYTFQMRKVCKPPSTLQSSVEKREIPSPKIFSSNQLFSNLGTYA